MILTVAYVAAMFLLDVARAFVDPQVRKRCIQIFPGVRHNALVCEYTELWPVLEVAADSVGV